MSNADEASEPKGSPTRLRRRGLRITFGEGYEVCYRTVGFLRFCYCTRIERAGRMLGKIGKFDGKYKKAWLFAVAFGDYASERVTIHGTCQNSATISLFADLRLASRARWFLSRSGHGGSPSTSTNTCLFQGPDTSAHRPHSVLAETDKNPIACRTRSPMHSNYTFNTSTLGSHPPKVMTIRLKERAET